MPGTYGQEPSIENSEALEASLTVPDDIGTTDLHIVLEVTDDGVPPLTAYKRIIVEARK